MGPKTSDPSLGYEAYWLCALVPAGILVGFLVPWHVEYFLVQRAYLQP